MYQSSQVYQDCTNNVPIVKKVQNSQRRSKDSQNSKNNHWCTNRHMSIEFAEYTKSASASADRVRRMHKTVCAYQYQQCCYIANGNKTCPSLLVFKNNNMAGFVCQSSRNVALRVEQPSVLKKFFSELQYSAAFGRERASLRVGSENMPNFVTFWPTLQFKEDQEKIQVVTSLFTLKMRHV